LLTTVFYTEKSNQFLSKRFEKYYYWFFVGKNLQNDQADFYVWKESAPIVCVFSSLRNCKPLGNPDLSFSMEEFVLVSDEITRCGRSKSFPQLPENALSSPHVCFPNTEEGRKAEEMALVVVSSGRHPSPQGPILLLSLREKKKMWPTVHRERFQAAPPSLNVFSLLRADRWRVDGPKFLCRRPEKRDLAAPRRSARKKTS
jgi:hypothetical protein